MATTPVATDNNAQKNAFISADNLGDRVGMSGAGTPQAGPDFVGTLFTWMSFLGFGQKEDVKEVEKKDDEKKDEKKDAKESEKESKGTSIKAGTEPDKPAAPQSTLGLSLQSAATQSGSGLTLGADKFSKKIDRSVERNQESVRRINKDSRDLDRQMVAAKTETVYLPEVRHFSGSPVSSLDKS